MTGLLRALWRYRGFILGSVRREFQARYANSMLGAAWTILNPLAMIVVYTVVFSNVMKARLPGSDSPFAYSIFLCAGVLPWGLFTEIVGRGQNVFLEHANLIKKLNFPRICLPAIVVLHAGLNFAIIFGLFLGFLLLVGGFPGWALLGAVPVLLTLIALGIGLGITLGVLNVFFRDTGQFFSIVLQFWFWLTPIVYSAAILPESIRGPLLAWNPMAPLVDASQTIFVGAKWPEWHALWMPAAVALALCLLGVHLFSRHAGEMVDEL